MESKKAMVFSRLSYILLTIALLLFGLGLIGVSIANFIAPFVSRIISYRYFFTKELKSKIDIFTISKKEKIELFEIIWYNSKKLGLVFIGSYAITRFGMFLAGLYLSLKEVSSYGLMIQLVGVIITIASTLFTVYNPRLAELRISCNKQGLLKFFSRSMGVFYILFVIGAIVLLFLIPPALTMIRSNVMLPATGVVLLYLVVVLLEQNHSLFASMIVIGNTVPFVWISLISGGLIVFLSYFSLAYTTTGILGLVMVQGIVQLAYNNWKWPSFVCNDFGLSFLRFVQISFTEVHILFRKKLA